MKRYGQRLTERGISVCFKRLCEKAHIAGGHGKPLSPCRRCAMSKQIVLPLLDDDPEFIINWLSIYGE